MDVKLKDLAFVGIPLAATLLLKKIPKVAVRVAAVAGDKKRGIDKFKAAIKIKNTGDVPVKVDFKVQAISGAYKVTILQGTGIPLAVGQELRFPSTGYDEITVPADFPLGSATCYAEVTARNTTVVTITRTIPDAWNVIAPVTRVEITALEVA